MLGLIVIVEIYTIRIWFTTLILIFDDDNDKIDNILIKQILSYKIIVFAYQWQEMSTWGRKRIRT